MSSIKIIRKIHGIMIFLFLTIFSSTLNAADVDCLMCHEQLTKGKSVHAAVQMGCPTCHAAIDAQDIPHKKNNNMARGLSAEVPALCFGCHDKSKFDGDTVHSPVKVGLCLSCHSPHQSNNEKLLLSAPPELCYTCHEKAMFSKKNVHMPVAGGMCMSCHSPHAAKERFLLQKRPVSVCLDCHGQIKGAPHVISGLTSKTGGHPIGSAKKMKNPPKDPLRQGREFYCGSCHDPHSSDWQKLFRYEAKSAMGLCQHCHKY